MHLVQCNNEQENININWAVIQETKQMPLKY